MFVVPLENVRTSRWCSWCGHIWKIIGHDRAGNSFSATHHCEVRCEYYRGSLETICRICHPPVPPPLDLKHLT